MAATISSAGDGVITASAATVATGATVTASVGDWLVVLVAVDNSGTNGAEPITNVVDSDAINSYTERAVINYDPGAASAGATLGIFTCSVTSALSNDTVTCNLSPNGTQAGIQVYRVQPGASEVVSFIACDTTGVTGNATSYTAATISVTSGDIIFGAASIETDDTVTGDTDTTNGSWSTILTRLGDGGADAAAMSCSSQHKTTTGTGNQDWACTTATARDSARTYLVIRSAVPANQTLVCTAPVLTYSAPTLTFKVNANLAATAPIVTLSSPAAVLDAGNTNLVCTAPTIILTASGTVLDPGNTNLVATAPVLTFSATATLGVGAPQTLVCTAPVVTISAPTVVKIAGNTNLVATAPTQTMTAPIAALIAGLATLVATSPTLVFSAPTALLDVVGGAEPPVHRSNRRPIAIGRRNRQTPLSEPPPTLLIY